MTDFVIRNVHVVAPASDLDARRDVYVQAGKIAAIDAPGTRSVEGAAIFDGAECVLIPGPIDLATIARDPGREDIEPLAATTTAAARGGFSAIVIAPMTTPAASTADAIRARHARVTAMAAGSAATSAGSFAAVDDEHTTGAELAEIGLMAREGATLFTNAPRPLRDLGFLRRALETVGATSTTALVWGADPAFASGGNGACLHESAIATRLGLEATPASAEVIRAHAITELARLTGARTLFGPVSTSKSLDALGSDVGAVACSWSLLLDEGAHLARPYDTALALEPPLRPAPDVAALVQAARAGQLALCSGHRPCAREDKDVEFARAAIGGSTLELTLPALVHIGAGAAPAGTLDATAAARAFSELPADYLGHPEWSAVAVGSEANFCMLASGDGEPLTAQDLSTPCRVSPLLGAPRRSTVELTVSRGQIVFSRAGHGA